MIDLKQFRPKIDLIQIIRIVASILKRVKTKKMYIIKAGILYLKSIGETNEKDETVISMCIQEERAFRFPTRKEAEAVNLKYEIGGEVFDIIED